VAGVKNLALFASSFQMHMGVAQAASLILVHILLKDKRKTKIQENLGKNLSLASASK
jgi:hypothetical protein